MIIAKVLIEIPILDLDVPFDYEVLPPFMITKGMRVQVSFNSRQLIGYVLDVIESPLDSSEYEREYGFKALPIERVLDDAPLINKELDELANFMAVQYLSPLIACYQTMLPPSLQPMSTKGAAIKYQKYVKVIYDNAVGLTVSQLDCFNYLSNLEEKGCLVSKVPYSLSILKTLEKKGLVSIEERELYRDPFNEQVDIVSPPHLTAEQEQVIKEIINMDSLSFLLQGVTGSGKTEVYINLAIYYLSLNKNVIILVPEISLTPMMVRRFKARIKEGIAIFHSGLTNGQKYDEYRRIKRREVRIVIGARSAIFAPLENLGLIVIDEEHSETYKHEKNPTYHARDIAIFRAKYYGAKLVLGSATPCLETSARAQRGIHKLLYLNERISQHGMPEVLIVNMIDELKNGNLTPCSDILKKHLNQVISKQEQAILLLNKRGFAKQVNCRNCGYIFKCPTCEVSLTYHKSNNELRCHYCGYNIQYPKRCPKCDSSFLRNNGLGIERVEEYFNKEFPQFRIIRMDQDTTRSKGDHRQILDAFENHQYDILLGTQMIAKGLDFENVTLVGVINADIGLGVDFRSAERVYELLAQVIGRSGRGDKRGIAIIQTNNPNHYAITCAANHNYKAFYALEMKNRKELHYPPYRYLAVITFSGRNLDRVNLGAESFKSELEREHYPDFEVLGPAQPYIKRFKDDYRMRLLLKYKDKDGIIEILRQRCLKKSWGNLKVTIDIDPLEEN